MFFDKFKAVKAFAHKLRVSNFSLPVRLIELIELLFSDIFLRFLLLEKSTLTSLFPTAFKAIREVKSSRPVSCFIAFLSKFIVFKFEILEVNT